MNEDFVSVLLPVYKEPLEWIKDSVESIRKQSYRYFELVIVIDNPDRSDVYEWLNSLHDPSISIYINEKNLGLVATLNKGIRLCQGTYIARMDADDIALPERIEKQLSYLKFNNLDLVGGNIELFNSEGTLGKSCLPNSLKRINHYLECGASIPHPTWLVKKCLYFSLDGYRDIPYAEDYDFLLRVMLSGYSIGVIKDVCLKYRQNMKGISQENKGKQKLTARVLRIQAIKKKILPVEYILASIYGEKSRIALYQNYYSYARRVRISFESRSLRKVIREIARFNPKYIRILCYDVLQSMANGLQKQL